MAEVSGNDLTRRLVAMVVLVLSAVMFNVSASAQGKSGNAVGTPSGTVGGGAAGAANRGGASGVGNPNPGGSPAAPGDPGASSGPRGTSTSRPGYLGGRNTAAVDPVIPPTATVSSITEANFGKCVVTSSVLAPQARMRGSNAGRIETVSQYLARGAIRGNRSNAALLASLQEELQKTNPDLTLAGSYLGIVAKTAITPELAADIGESLCSPMSADMASTVAKIAEEQRKRLALEP